MRSDVLFKESFKVSPLLFLQLMGLGAFNVWGLVSDTSAYLLASGIYGPPANVGSSCSYMATLVLCALLARRVSEAASRPAFLVGCGAVGCVGTLVLALAFFVGDPLNAVVAVVGAVALGASRGVLILVWMDVYARLDMRTMLVSYSVSLVVLTLGGGLFNLLGTLSPLVSIVFAAMLPPLCASLAFNCSSSLERPVAQGEEEARSWSFPIKPVLMLVAYTFVVQLVGGLLDSGGTVAVAMSGNVLTALALLIVGLTSFKWFKMGLLYQVSLLAVLTALLVCMVPLSPMTSFLAHFLSGLGFSVFITFATVLLCSVCYRYGVNAYWLFGITVAARVPAELAATVLSSHMEAPSASAAPVVVAVAVALVALCTACGSENDYRTTWGIVPRGANQEGSVCARATYASYLNRCSEVARTYGLTHREEEVFSMLARGMSVPAIEEALVIAKNTAKSHVRKIYAKTGVHSREELADLVGRDNIPVSDRCPDSFPQG